LILPLIYLKENHEGGGTMNNRFKYFLQLALLDQLLLEKLITKKEYDKVNNYMKKKYKIQDILV